MKCSHILHIHIIHTYIHNYSALITHICVQSLSTESTHIIRPEPPDALHKSYQNLDRAPPPPDMHKSIIAALAKTSLDVPSPKVSHRPWTVGISEPPKACEEYEEITEFCRLSGLGFRAWDKLQLHGSIVSKTGHRLLSSSTTLLTQRVHIHYLWN